MYLLALLLSALAALPPAQAQRRPAAPAAPAGPFKTPLTVADMTGKQAVIDTTAGTFVIDLRPDLAPNHVGYFMKLARDGAYNGTIFHRVVKYGIVQGGDPLSKDPAKAKLYGTGGLGVLKAEMGAEKATRGAVSAVLQPGRPDSGGAQFFVCVTDQPGLDGQYTVFGRVVEGIEVVQQLSAVDADAQGRPTARLTIKSVTIRDTPVDPFAKAAPGELGGYCAIVETTKGAMTLEFLAGKAPDTVRNFLQLAAAGVYDNTPFHRVVANFVIQTGAAAYRQPPLTAAQMKLIHNLAPEFN